MIYVVNNVYKRDHFTSLIVDFVFVDIYNCVVIYTKYFVVS